jgi:hypothetical protein
MIKRASTELDKISRALPHVFLIDWPPDWWLPNVRPELQQEAGARHEQTLEAVRCSAGMEPSPLTRFLSLFLLARATA